MSLTTGALRAPAPRLVPPRAYRRFLHPLVLRPRGAVDARGLERSEVYFPYFAMRVRYDDARARALLEPMGIAAPRLEDYFERISRVRARRALGQAAARPRRRRRAGRHVLRRAHPRAQPVAGRGRNARVRKRTATAVSSGSCWIER
jgi:hypothetical protein